MLLKNCIIALGVVFCACLEANSTVYVAPEWSYLSSSWGNDKSQQGSLWGAAVGYSYHPKDSWYFLSEFTYRAGFLKGSAGNDPTQEYITELRGGYNLTAALLGKITITPFLGFGSYVFNQSIGGGYDFQSYFWYVPIGLFFSYECSQDWSVGFLGMGAPSFGGRWRVSSWKNAPTSALWKGELYAVYTKLHPFELGLSALVKGWSYRSDEDLIEQNNTYYGLKLTFAYAF